jgi:hypothetical protein
MAVLRSLLALVTVTGASFSRETAPDDFAYQMCGTFLVAVGGEDQGSGTLTAYANGDREDVRGVCPYDGCGGDAPRGDYAGRPLFFQLIMYADENGEEMSFEYASADGATTR